MSTNVAKPVKVAIIGASGTYGKGILARAEKIGVEAVVVTRSPHKFKDVKPTTTVVEAQLDEEEKLQEAFAGCDGVISALGDDRKQRPKTHNLPHVWNAMKAAGVTKYVGMGSGAMMMPGEKRGGFQRTVHPLLSVLKLFGVDFLEQNEWERDSLLLGKNGADGITWVLTRPVRPTKTPFAGAYVHKDQRGPINCSIYVINMFQTHRVIAKQPNSKMCLVCGLQNEPGLRAAFYELESQQLVGLFTPRNHQQGYPGRLHGGIAASMLDETIGRAIRLSHGDALWGVTIELNAKFRQPIPLDGKIKTVARITKETRRHFAGEGAIILPNGRVAVEARGRYLKMSIDSISDFDFEEQQWKVIPHEEDPEMIELPRRWASSQE